MRKITTISLLLVFVALALLASTALAQSGGYSLDTADNVGWWTSITIGTDGLPIISYDDETNDDLKVTHCSNPFCGPYRSRR